MRASESLSSTWNIVREDNYGNAIIEQDRLFYVVNVEGSPCIAATSLQSYAQVLACA